MKKLLLTTAIISVMMGGQVAKAQTSIKNKNGFNLSITPSAGLYHFINSIDASPTNFLFGFKAAFGYGGINLSTGYLTGTRNEFGGRYSIVPLTIGFSFFGNNNDKAFTVTDNTYLGVAFTNGNISIGGTEVNASNVGFLFGGELGFRYNITNNFSLSLNNDFAFIIRPNELTVEATDGNAKESATISTTLANVFLYQFGLSAKYIF